MHKREKKMANHDLRGKDGRSGIHSEVRVYSGELLSPLPPFFSVFSLCVLLLAHHFSFSVTALLYVLLSKYVCVNTIYDSAVIMLCVLA